MSNIKTIKGAGAVPSAHLLAVFIFATVMFFCDNSHSATWHVNPEDSISGVIGLCGSGDTVIINRGVYAERFVVDRPLSIIGDGFPVIDGGGAGTVIRISAPGTVVRGLRIRGSGTSLSIENSGIELENAPGSAIEDNILEDVLFGIYLKNSPGASVRNNRIYGKDLPLPERGDGIRIWYSSDSRITGNTISGARDLVVWWSSNTLIKGNRVEDGRYGLHYMYSDNNVFEDNLFADNAVGGFLMYSGNIKFFRNIFTRNKGMAGGYGVGFKDLDDVYAEDNLFADNRVGIYMDNSPHLADSWNELSGNVIAYNDIGISMMPSIERNKIWGNSFIDNHEQVEVRGGGALEGNLWNTESRGNYWSDYRGFDEDNDGTGDIPYVSEKLFERLMNRNEALRIFIYSPAARAIELASQAFPIMKPTPKLVDRFPLLSPQVPEYPGADKRERRPGFLVVSFLLLFTPVISYVTVIRQRKREC